MSESNREFKRFWMNCFFFVLKRKLNEWMNEISEWSYALDQNSDQMHRTVGKSQIKLREMAEEISDVEKTAQSTNHHEGNDISLRSRLKWSEAKQVNSSPINWGARKWNGHWPDCHHDSSNSSHYFSLFQQTASVMLLFAKTFRLEWHLSDNIRDGFNSGYLWARRSPTIANLKTMSMYIR